MTFGVTWVNRDGGEEADRRTLTLFSKWQPPAGVDFKAFYDYADGSGGMAIIETDSAEKLLETMAPWATFFSFTVRPLVSSEKASEIYGKTIAWRDSIR